MTEEIVVTIPAPTCTTIRNRKLANAPLIAVGVCLLGACSGGADATLEPDVAAEAVSLKFFSGPAACTDLAAHIRDSAEAMMLAQLEPSSADGTIEVGAPGAGIPVAAPAPNAPSSDSATGDNGAGLATQGGSRFSETTLRSSGVDEPDPVKNDGELLFALRRDADQLILTRAGLRPAESMRVQARVAWPVANTGESAYGLFMLDRSRVVALSVGGGYGTPMPVAMKTSPVCNDAGCGGGPLTPPWVQMRLVDAASADLATTWSLRLPGQLIGARRIGDKLYLATQSELRLPDAVSFQPAMTPAMTSAQYAAALDGLKASNSKLIRETPLSYWLASLAPTEGESTATSTTTPPEPTLAECAAYARTAVATRLGWLRISAIDVATRKLENQTVLATASGLYMSARSMILVTPQWIRNDPYKRYTLAHRFELDSQGLPRHDASGRFPGYLLNDYAIDERADGVIRVVAMQADRSGSWTTIENLGRAPLDSAAGATAGTTPAATSPVAPPDPPKFRLASLGRSEPIARGETLRSARFIGDRVYFVTFRSVDPFFVYDLSDPARPVALGELKIPGFSTWLQPVGSNHLLGIGYDSGGWPRRIKASLFDVSDPRAPREQAVLSLGDSYTDSDALWDPHAFTWLPASDPADGGTMAIPIRSYAYSQYGTRDESGIRVVAVAPRSVAAPLSLSGTLDMVDLRSAPAGPGIAPTYGWRSTDPRRSIIIDDTVYGVADGAIRAARLDQPGSPLGTLLIP